MPNPFNDPIISEFRANNGRVGGPFEGSRLLLLTTTGARSGAPHTTPVGCLPDGDRVLVIASAGGADRHPAWFHNLVAHPEVTVEDGVFTYRARADVLTGDERDRLFARAVEADPGWAEYQAGTDRVIPVIALTQVDGGPPPGPLGDGLVALHGAFRRELALIRAEVARSGAAVGAQLRVNCLTLCEGLGVHHRHEDGGLFLFLEQHHPDLAPALARMRDEHAAMTALLDELRALLSQPSPDPSALAAEVDRLTAQVEAHLDYEESELVPILNAVPTPG
ncbi:nitroreductase/quinone reductase family protein [Actinomadura flavalba]|uniref:nitroreductase/quinone reductase family protein n=1 Tax=Actinomadura flavalba TaxID=1120938 RepID=UPI000380C897|nr:nitroreductase/quinone reductase family protein [Actinomadura flavalba]